MGSAASPEAWARVIDDPAVDAQRFWALVDETRADWVAQYQHLLGLIHVPVVLLFLGMNAPITNEGRARKPKDVSALMGTHPQLIARAMVETLRPACHMKPGEIDSVHGNRVGVLR